MYRESEPGTMECTRLIFTYCIFTHLPYIGAFWNFVLVTVVQKQLPGQRLLVDFKMGDYEIVLKGGLKFKRAQSAKEASI